MAARGGRAPSKSMEPAVRSPQSRCTGRSMETRHDYCREQQQLLRKLRESQTPATNDADQERAHVLLWAERLWATRMLLAHRRRGQQPTDEHLQVIFDLFVAQEDGVLPPGGCGVIEDGTWEIQVATERGGAGASGKLDDATWAKRRAYWMYPRLEP